MESGGPRKHVLDGPDPPCKGAIITEKDIPGHARQHCVMSCAKIVGGCGFGWAEGSTRSSVFDRLHQCALMRGHIVAT